MTSHIRNQRIFLFVCFFLRMKPKIAFEYLDRHSMREIATCSMDQGRAEEHESGANNLKFAHWLHKRPVAPLTGFWTAENIPTPQPSQSPFVHSSPTFLFDAHHTSCWTASAPQSTTSKPTPLLCSRPVLDRRKLSRHHKSRRCRSICTNMKIYALSRGFKPRKLFALANDLCRSYRKAFHMAFRNAY